MNKKMELYKISDFVYFNNENGFGVIIDSDGNVLRKYIKATYNPNRKQHEVKSPIYPNVLKFRTKNEANKIAKKMHLPIANVKRFGNRFESGWAICLDVHRADCFMADFE